MSLTLSPRELGHAGIARDPYRAGNIWHCTHTSTADRPALQAV